MQQLQGTAAVANDDVKIQTWVVETSNAAGKNLVPFYRQAPALASLSPHPSRGRLGMVLSLMLLVGALTRVSSHHDHGCVCLLTPLP